MLLHYLINQPGPSRFRAGAVVCEQRRTGLDSAHAPVPGLRSQTSTPPNISMSLVCWSFLTGFQNVPAKSSNNDQVLPLFAAISFSKTKNFKLFLLYLRNLPKDPKK